MFWSILGENQLGEFISLDIFREIWCPSDSRILLHMGLNIARVYDQIYLKH